MVKNIGAGVERTLKYSIFFILYTTLIAFVILFFAKIFFPHDTGLFYSNNQFKAFGVYTSAGAYKELLGYWILPLLVVGSVADYLLITLLMKLTAKKKK